MDNNKKDFVYNKHPKTEKKQSNSVSFYIVLALIIFCVLGSVLGSFAFVENRVKADELENTYTFNQLINYRDFSTQNNNGISFINTNDGNLVLNGTASGTAVFRLNIPRIDYTHCYYLKGCPLNGSSTTYSLGLYGQTGANIGLVDYGSGIISIPSVSFPSDTLNQLQIVVRNGTVCNNLRFTPQLIDLTLLGVSSNISITDLNVLLSYLPYDSGTSVSISNGQSISFAYAKYLGYNQGYDAGFSDGFNSGSSQITNDLGLFQFSNNYIQANYGNIDSPWQDTKYSFTIGNLFGTYYGGFYGKSDTNFESIIDTFSIPTVLDGKSLSRLLLTFDFSSVNGGLGLRLSEYPILNFVYQNYDGTYDFSTHTYEEACRYAFYYGDGDIIYTNVQFPLTTFPFDTSKTFLKKITVELLGTDSYIYGMFSGGANPIANSAYQNGYTKGYEDGSADGEWSGYNVGYNKGYSAGVDSSSNYSFLSLISAVVDVPVKAFTSLFNFEVFEVNLSGFFFFLLTFAVVLKVISMLK